MTQQVIFTGTLPNDTTGDTSVVAFTKVNTNFTQLFNGTFTYPTINVSGFAVNASGNVTIAAPTSGVALSVIGAAGANGAQFFPASAAAGWVVTGTDVAFATLNSSAATNRSLIALQQGGTTTLRMGSDGSNALLSDSTNGDLCIVPPGHDVRIGFSAGGTTSFHITTAGAITSIGPIGVNGSTAPAQSTGYGTPTGNAKQASFAASSITLPNLAAAVAQLIIDIKATGLIGN